MQTASFLGAINDILLDEQSVLLPPASTLLFDTDGVTDVQDGDGNQFGLERLRQALLAQAKAAVTHFWKRLPPIAALRRNTMTSHWLRCSLNKDSKP